jgi:hypothetical protein
LAIVEAARIAFVTNRTVTLIEHAIEDARAEGAAIGVTVDPGEDGVDECIDLSTALSMLGISRAAYDLKCRGNMTAIDDVDMDRLTTRVLATIESVVEAKVLAERERVNDWWAWWIRGNVADGSRIDRRDAGISSLEAAPK